MAVTGHVLGVPLEDIPTLAERLFALLHTDWPAYGLKDRTRPGEAVDLVGSAPELTAYFDQMIDARRSGDVVADDLIAQLVATQVDGEWLTNQRIRSLAINFLTAGLSTTNLISNLLYRLMTSEDFDANRPRRSRRDPCGRGGVAPVRAAGAVPVSHRQGGHRDRRPRTASWVSGW